MFTSIIGFLAALGVKLSTAVAGFAGGIVSLSFLQGLTRAQALSATIVGTLSAVYLTPLAVDKLVIAADLQNGAAFVIGLCAMSVIPSIQTAVKLWANRIDKAATQPRGSKE